ncbi:hypothetical protein WJX75_006821 [Coccomyxa subellipsoidea]|uniref:Secreted protein n=1 Tax=Coccomyxa subellipsoidea TaxID=248742 RepID=A0ABR2YB05_9CHLO
MLQVSWHPGLVAPCCPGPCFPLACNIWCSARWQLRGIVQGALLQPALLALQRESRNVHRQLAEQVQLLLRCGRSFLAGVGRAVRWALAALRLTQRRRFSVAPLRLSTLTTCQHMVLKRPA